MSTSFKPENINKPAPLWYRRMMNGMILFIIPGLVGLIQGIPLKADTRNVWMMVLAFLPALLKGVAMMLGNGSVYHVDENKPNEK